MGSAPAEGSDAAIYPDLARVNLLRMRGDYSSALQHCRGILHKFPNNLTANQLLGDLCIDTGDLNQAKEWYELALDISPNHPQVAKKLRDVTQKLEHEETAGMVEQLGIPPSKSKNGLVAVGLAAAVIVIAGIAYYLGTNKPATEVASQAPKQTEISAPVTNPPGPEPGNPAVRMPEATVPSTALSTEESSLNALITQRSQYGAKVAGLSIDPRTFSMTLTFRVESSEDRRAIAAELASVAMENSPTTRLVTVRALEGSALTYLADVRRETYDETKIEAWKQANPDPAMVVSHLLTQEWPATQPPPSEAPLQGGTTGP